MELEQIGRYQIKSELGRGGMATVYLGYDPRFQREVALKIIPREFLHDPTFRSRFEREAQLIAALEHPAIVPVYDFGEEDGQPYLVMRYLTGGSLTKRLKQGAIPFAETVSIISRLAPALDAAHQQGIIHRDLKPDNILFDQWDQPFITDFGIAKLAEDGSEGVTSEGAIIGTPAYMSPEQANGEEIDGRSDLYSLAVITFQMLSGKLPFEANTPIGLVMKHVTQPAPDILTLKADLPAGCREVMIRAMAKSREQRFATANLFARALAGTLEVTPISSAEALPSSEPESPLETQRLRARIQEVPPEPEEEGVICPKCQMANPIQVHFCVICNTRLQIDCPMCHTPNRIDIPLCQHCGADLVRSQAMRTGLQQARKRTLSKRDQAFKEKAARQMREKLQSLFQALDSRKTRTEAARQLEQLVGKPTFSILIENLLNGSEPQERLASALVLAQLCERSEVDPELKAQAVEAFVEALEDPDPEVQHQVQALVDKYAGRRSREISDIFRGLMGWLKGE